MHITGLRYIKVKGTWTHDGALNTGHFVSPLWHDLKHRPSQEPQSASKGDPFPLESIFLFIDTNTDITGIWGPISDSIAHQIDKSLNPILMGENPHQIEQLWDKMYRASGGGLEPGIIYAISAVDLALWDLKGKDLNAPVFKLLGGPSRDRVKAYASMPGYNNAPEAAATQSKELVGQGYTAIKWFFGHHPSEGEIGFEENVSLIQKVREAVGSDQDIMFDCWNSWDVHYTLRLIDAVQSYRPLWIEEPVMQHILSDYAQIRQATRHTKIAGGEHAYTRWGIKPWLDIGAVDIIQPDPRWAGGLTEMTKICGLASSYGIPVIPHAGGPASTHLIASQSTSTCPMQEHALRDTVTVQYFLKNKCVPINGYIELSDLPGLGMALDQDVIEQQQELDF